MSFDIEDQTDIVRNVQDGHFMVQYRTYRVYYPLNNYKYSDILQHIAAVDETPVFTLGPGGVAEFLKWNKEGNNDHHNV